MLPQNAGVTVTSITPPPNLDVSITLNTNTMVGRNKVNRMAHSTANFYSGTAQSDQTIELAPATVDPQTLLPIPASYAAPMTSPSKIIQVSSTRPIVVLVTVNNIVTTIPVTKLLAIDSPVSAIQIQNFDTVNSVQILLTYLT